MTNNLQTPELGDFVVAVDLHYSLDSTVEWKNGEADGDEIQHIEVAASFCLSPVFYVSILIWQSTTNGYQALH